jgi:uncharacterized protein YbjT (DUF2867 family)
MADPHPTPAGPDRTVLLAGASGLVGRELRRQLLADASVAAVHALVRRELDVEHPKLTQHRVDFAALPPLPPADDAYIALGTTIKVAGSQEAFRAVDHDAVLAVARAAYAAGVGRLGVVSAMGADTGSRIFYSRVKGEVEQALRGVGFGGLVVARPSMLAGDRQSVGQPVRGGELMALRLTRAMRPLIPANYRSIQAADVAAALLREVPRASGVKVLLSGQMQRGA